MIDGAATLHGTDLRQVPLDRLLNTTHAWYLERLLAGTGDEAQTRLDEFQRVMEGDPIATGDADEATVTKWEVRPEVQAAQHGMMGLAQMAPPFDPNAGPPAEVGAQPD